MSSSEEYSMKFQSFWYWSEWARQKSTRWSFKASDTDLNELVRTVLDEVSKLLILIWMSSSEEYSMKFQRFRFRSSFICQVTSTRRQRSDLCGLRVKLPLVTTSL